MTADREFNAEIQLKCPFCGGHVQADRERGEIVHELPPCQRFIDEEPDDFLASCRKKMSN